MSQKPTAKPHKLPRPTYWPFFTALGVVLIFWGILTTWFITGIGLITFGIALGGWISDLNNELKNEEHHEL
jgi:hypothetical protein